jgi:hypothetical protein
MNPLYDDYTGEYYDGSGNASEDPKVRDDRVRRALAGERTLIALKLDPLSTFIRGVQVGALVIGGVNTIFPGQFGVVDWPLWLRAVLGGACVLLAIHFLLEQRGYMIARRISKA